MTIGNSTGSSSDDHLLHDDDDDGDGDTSKYDTQHWNQTLQKQRDSLFERKGGKMVHISDVASLDVIPTPMAGIQGADIDVDADLIFILY